MESVWAELEGVNYAINNSSDARPAGLAADTLGSRRSRTDNFARPLRSTSSRSLAVFARTVGAANVDARIRAKARLGELA